MSNDVKQFIRERTTFPAWIAGWAIYRETIMKMLSKPELSTVLSMYSMCISFYTFVLNFGAKRSDLHSFLAEDVSALLFVLSAIVSAYVTVRFVRQMRLAVSRRRVR